MEQLIKGLDYDTSRRLRDVSKTHRKHWESIKYQCMYCQQPVSDALRFSGTYRVFHLACSFGNNRHGDHLTIYKIGHIWYYGNLVLSRIMNGEWLMGGVVIKHKKAEELYQKFLKWNSV